MAVSMRASLGSLGASVLAGASKRAIQWAAGTVPPPPPKARRETLYDATYSGDVALMVDDIGWIPETQVLANSNDPSELGSYDRRATVQRARLYYVKDAMSKQAVRLYTTYCVGGGFSIKARDYEDEGANAPVGPDDFNDEADAKTAALQSEANDFWEHPANAPVFSTEAQTINSDKLNVDGELFYVLIPPVQGPDVDEHGNLVDGAPMTRVRVIKDCLQIAAIYYNPEDDSEPWYYLRVWREGPLGKQTLRKALYPDYRLFITRTPDANGVLSLPPAPTDGPFQGATVITRQFLFHQKVNTIAERGNSLLTPVMDWTKVNRNYLEDRATISKAHARIAWKRIIKGPASAIAAFGRRNISSQGAQTGVPLPSTAGNTLNVNPGMDWEAQNAQDGGKNAYIESRNFRLMFYAGVGFAEHYFGDGSNGTRATSKSMERPTELQLQAYQTILKAGYEVMFAFHLVATGREYDSHAVWVDAPQILEDDTATVVTSILEVIGLLPEFDIDEVLLKLLNALSVDDPQDIIVKIRRRQKQLYQQYLELVYAQAGLDPAAVAPDGSDPGAAQQFIAQQAKVIAMLTPASDPTKMPGPKKAPQFAQGQLGAKLAQRKPAPRGTRPTDPLKTA